MQKISTGQDSTLVHPPYKDVQMKKHCHNCKHLEWVDGDVNDPEGWTCNKRQYRSEYDEHLHLYHLEREFYRIVSKRCFEGK